MGTTGYVIECKCCKVRAHPLPVKNYPYREILTCPECEFSEELQIILKAFCKELKDKGRQNALNFLSSPPWQNCGAMIQSDLDDGGDFTNDRIRDCAFVLVEKRKD